MTFLPIRPLLDLDMAAALALNNDHAVELSAETPRTWDDLVSVAWAAWGIVDQYDRLAAFLIALDDAGTPRGPNHRWFQERRENFVYVDRVVTAAFARNRGLARQLYLALIDAARRAGRESVVCEVNLEPPNPGSLAFHERLGFVPVGEAHLAERGKTVRYLERRLG